MSMALLVQITNIVYQKMNLMSSLWWFFIRLWIATLFFKAGLTKIEDFETTIFLFAEEYQVPLLSPYLAAILATAFELIMPVALVLGLATRLAAIPLLIMTAVIQFTYLEHLQHYYWAILLSGLILNGAGKLSLDYYIWRNEQPKHYWRNGNVKVRLANCYSAFKNNYTALPLKANSAACKFFEKALYVIKL